MTSDHGDSGPLKGIRVLDLTRLIPGPVCSLHLADMGADVIKVEDPQRGDYARTTRGYFAPINRNKRSVTLDLKQARGQALFLDLARQAQVVMEGFRPGVVQRLGIDYDAVAAVNPAIVYCAITGYGQTGPYRHRAGHDLNYCSLAGINDQIGAVDGPPVIPNLQLADMLGGSLSAIMGILAALVDAQRSGRGRYVDVAMADCVLAHSLMPLTALRERGRVAPRGQDFLSGALPWYAIYETADGRYLSLAALEDKFWCAFCDAIQRLDWRERPSETATRLELGRELADLFRTQPLSHWRRLLEPVDCCFSPVLDLSETMVDPHFRERGMWLGELQHLQYALPVKFSDFACSIARQAPAHGEHTGEVLQELGYSAAEIDALRAQRVV